MLITLKNWTKKLVCLVYDESGKQIVEMSTTFPVQLVRDGANVIVTGFLL